MLHTIFMFNRSPTLLAKDVVHVYKLRMACVSHTVVADENNINNVRQVPIDKASM